MKPSLRTQAILVVTGLILVIALIAAIWYLLFSAAIFSPNDSAYLDTAASIDPAELEQGPFRWVLKSGNSDAGELTTKAQYHAATNKLITFTINYRDGSVVERHYKLAAYPEDVLELEKEFRPHPEQPGKFLSRQTTHIHDGKTETTNQFFRWQDGTLRMERVLESDGSGTTTFYEADGITIKSSVRSEPDLQRTEAG